MFPNRKPAPSRLPQAPDCLAPPLLSCLESDACYNSIINGSPSLCCATSRSFLQAGETDAMRPIRVPHLLLHKVYLLRIHGVLCLDLEKVSQCSQMPVKQGVWGLTALFENRTFPLLAQRGKSPWWKPPIIIFVVSSSPRSSWKGHRTPWLPRVSGWLPKASRHLPIWRVL